MEWRRGHGAARMEGAVTHVLVCVTLWSDGSREGGGGRLRWLAGWVVSCGSSSGVQSSLKGGYGALAGPYPWSGHVGAAWGVGGRAGRCVDGCQGPGLP